LRARTLLLGDVVDAALTEVTTPVQSFSEGNNPGYAAFKTQWTTTTPRPTMVYAAANDGMLHGFVGSSGVEQFAYVPSATFQGPTGTPQVNGLAALGNPIFAHHYYVDATPINYDIDLNRTGTNASGSTGSPNWHTLLIGGLAKGGMSYYAIDVTNPASMSSEAAVAADVAWEFTDSTMGYSYGAPIVVKTVQYGWVVAFTSGYNSSSSVGYLYLVNPATGALLQKIATPSASSGLTQASAYVQDYTDYTADSIYVGDLNGQLWRFDLTTASGTYPAPTLLATLTDASGNAQPVTTAPLIEIHPTTRKRYVMVGTGQFLSASDVTSTSQQSFYVIMDGTAAGFNAVATPITRTNLTSVTASGLVAGITLGVTSKGWYIDLGTDPTSGYAWRVDIKPTSYNGTVAFAAFLPSGNACALSGLGEIYSVNYATATSILTSQPSGFYAVPSAVVNLNYIGLTQSSSSGSSAELIAGLANGTVIKIPETLTSSVTTRLLNWRELPAVE
jgi:type IV pilus assembly protein PilY1